MNLITIKSLNHVSYLMQHLQGTSYRCWIYLFNTLPFLDLILNWIILFYWLKTILITCELTGIPSHKFIFWILYYHIMSHLPTCVNFWGWENVMPNFWNSLTVVIKINGVNSSKLFFPLWGYLNEKEKKKKKVNINNLQTVETLKHDKCNIWNQSRNIMLAKRSF